jgi:hypothetical protein
MLGNIGVIVLQYKAYKSKKIGGKYNRKKSRPSQNFVKTIRHFLTKPKVRIFFKPFQKIKKF